MAISLNRIDPSETGLIASLADQIWHAYYIDLISLEQIDYMLGKFYSHGALNQQINEGQQFYKIINDGKISGFISISRKGQDDYFLHKFYLQADARGKNTGSEVMSMIREKIKTDNGGREAIIRLTVNRQNYKAINFYFKNSFRIEKVEDFDIGNGFFMNDFVMIYEPA